MRKNWNQTLCLRLAHCNTESICAYMCEYASAMGGTIELPRVEVLQAEYVDWYCFQVPYCAFSIAIDASH